MVIHDPLGGETYVLYLSTCFGTLFGRAKGRSTLLEVFMCLMFGKATGNQGVPSQYCGDEVSVYEFSRLVEKIRLVRLLQIDITVCFHRANHYEPIETAWNCKVAAYFYKASTGHIILICNDLQNESEERQMAISVQPLACGFTSAAWTTFCWPPCGAGPGLPSRTVEGDPAEDFETSSRREISEVGTSPKDKISCLQRNTRHLTASHTGDTCMGIYIYTI